MAYFAVPAKNYDFDKVFEVAIDGNAEDCVSDEDTIEILASVENFKILSDKLRSNKIQPEDAELRMLPNQEMELDVDDTLQVMRTIDAIEELDDVQNVFTNLKISDEAMAALDAD
jgi:transcriptional/translational regulatory protein YebC/TACO1